jgi:hypothetical protein
MRPPGSARRKTHRIPQVGRARACYHGSRRSPAGAARAGSTEPRGYADAPLRHRTERHLHPTSRRRSQSSAAGPRDVGLARADARRRRRVPVGGGVENARLVFDAGAIVGQHDVESQCLGTVCASILIVGRSDMAFQNASPFCAGSLGAAGRLVLSRRRDGLPVPSRRGPMTTVLIRGVEAERTFVPQPAEPGLFLLAALGVARRLSRSRSSAD